MRIPASPADAVVNVASHPLALAFPIDALYSAIAWKQSAFACCNHRLSPGSERPVTRPEPRIDIEIQLLRLVQLALAGAEIVTQRSEEIRHQGSGLMSIGGIRLAEL
jgi:hypothetical protein